MLNVVSPEKARDIIREKFNYVAEKEYVKLSECLGRTVFEDMYSGENIPAFDRSTVDGYAVISSDSYGSSETMPDQLEIKGEILMGENSRLTLKSGECIRVSTGGMLPEGADGVVMVENTDSSLEPLCLIFKAISPFENVTRQGDDVRKGDLICTKGKKITSRDIGIFASLGFSRVPCIRKLRVGIISTGDELVPIESCFEKGKIRDVNSHILCALMEEYGCVGTEYGIIRDDFDSIVSAMNKAVEENDIVLISGGSSAGAKDMTVEIIKKYGEVYLHGIAMKPGKPTIVGKVKEKAVFGLPGHPAAAYFVAMSFVRLIIESVYGEITQETVKAKITTNISSNHGREEIVCVTVEDGKAQPVLFKSGVVSLLSRSDGYIIIDRNTEGVRQGDTVKVILF